MRLAIALVFVAHYVILSYTVSAQAEAPGLGESKLKLEAIDPDLAESEVDKSKSKGEKIDPTLIESATELPKSKGEGIDPDLTTPTESAEVPPVEKPPTKEDVPIVQTTPEVVPEKTAEGGGVQPLAPQPPACR